MAACGGGHSPLALSPSKFRETVDLMEQWGRSAALQEKVRGYMVQVLENDLADGAAEAGSFATVGSQTRVRVLHCEHCQLKLDILLITPCGCQFCPLCMDENVSRQTLLT